MKKICVLKNTIQDYAWGSRTDISEFLGEPTPAEKPQAEMWMGAHPKAPSQVLDDGNWKSLLDLIDRSPEEILGKQVAEKYDGKLPFLLKVLAAAKPLSIQAHPTLDQAKEGFAREQGLGIPLSTANRNYKDANHKPETTCALTPFWALNGFRKIDEMVTLLGEVCPSELAEEIDDLKAHSDPDGLKRFFSSIMTMDGTRQKSAVEEAVGYALEHREQNPVYGWMMRLNSEYSGDIGVLSPILLNLVKLLPGQATFLHAGQLHAYLEGFGIELMANSDNVLRGGLTPKHIDVPELLKILNFTEKEVDILAPQESGGGESVYPSEVDEFQLSVINLDSNGSYNSSTDRNIEIMICASGMASVKDRASGEILELNKGVSILVPAAGEGYSIEGEVTLYKATVA